MIVTFTANPALDRTVELPSPLRPGEVQHAISAREDAAGKGINVARALHADGVAVRAVLPLAADDPYRRLLGGDVDVIAVETDRHARVNTAITDSAGETTKINLPGASVDDAEVRRMIDAVVEAADGAHWLALCGSLPPGAPIDLYALIAAACRAGLADPPRIAVDASGLPLAAVLAFATQSAPVDLITPNEDELAGLIVELEALDGRSLAPLILGEEERRGLPGRSVFSAEQTSDDGSWARVTASAETNRRIERFAAALVGDPDAIARVGGMLVPTLVGGMLVTLGGDGAVLIDADGARTAPVPADVPVRSTVGAGDSALAGLLAADVSGADANERLRSAIRHGSATAALPGTRLATPADLPTDDLPVRRLG